MMTWTDYGMPAPVAGGWLTDPLPEDISPQALAEQARKESIEALGFAYVPPKRREITLGGGLGGLSAEAAEARLAAVSRQSYKQAVMRAGPYLLDDGHTLEVPSYFYHEQAATFWRSVGFKYERDFYLWARDTRMPLRGKVYPAEVWLQRARVKYAEFWPELKATETK